MSKIKQILGKKTWIGILAALILSAALDAIGALLMCRGIISEMPMWVYGSYGIGSFVGVRIAVREEQGTLLHGLTIYIILCAIVCLGGIATFGGITFAGSGVGVFLGLASGCLAGGLIRGGTVKKRKGKRKMRANRGK